MNKNVVNAHSQRATNILKDCACVCVRLLYSRLLHIAVAAAAIDRRFRESIIIIIVGAQSSSRPYYYHRRCNAISIGTKEAK